MKKTQNLLLMQNIKKKWKENEEKKKEKTVQTQLAPFILVMNASVIWNERV